MLQPLLRRIEALEAKAPDHGMRVVTRHEDLQWSPEGRVRHAAEFSAGLPKHRGLTVVVRRFRAAEIAASS
jgi:hypothetical protein